MTRGKKPSKKAAADLPKEFKNQIAELGGSEIGLVAQKKLHKFDLQNSFSIPTSQVRAEFLTPLEKALLDDKEVINAWLIDPSLNMSCLSVSMWQHWKSKKTLYSLTINWSSVLKSNDGALKEGALVQLWSFRRGVELWLALVNVDEKKRDNGSRSYGQPLTTSTLSHTDPSSAADDYVQDDRKEATMIRAGYLAYMYMMNGFVPSCF